MCKDEDVVIAFFVDGEFASALRVEAVFPVASGVGAEQDNHVGGGELFADDAGDQL